MPQLSLYLNDAAMGQLRTQAKDSGRSLSRYVSQLILEDSPSNGWPEGYWESVYGCLQDESFRIPAEPDVELDDALPAFAEEGRHVFPG